MFVYARGQGEASSIYWFISLCRRLCFVQLISNDFSLAKYFSAHRAKRQRSKRERGSGRKRNSQSENLFYILFYLPLGFDKACAGGGGEGKRQRRLAACGNFHSSPAALFI